MLSLSLLLLFIIINIQFINNIIIVIIISLIINIIINIIRTRNILIIPIIVVVIIMNIYNIKICCINRTLINFKIYYYC